MQLGSRGGIILFSNRLAYYYLLLIKHPPSSGGTFDCGQGYLLEDWCRIKSLQLNISLDFKYISLQTFGLLNFLAESFIFSYMGLSLFTFQHHQWNIGFIAWTFVSFLRPISIFSYLQLE